MNPPKFTITLKEYMKRNPSFLLSNCVSDCLFFFAVCTKVLVQSVERKSGDLKANVQ